MVSRRLSDGDPRVLASPGLGTGELGLTADDVKNSRNARLTVETSPTMVLPLLSHYAIGLKTICRLSQYSSDCENFLPNCK